MSKVILPLPEKWIVYDYGNQQIIEKWLYFFVDNFQAKITDDYFYKMFFLEQKKGFYNDFYSAVNQNRKINFLNQSLDYKQLLEDILTDKISVVFEESLPQIKQTMQNHFSHLINNTYSNLTKQILKSYLIENEVDSGNFVVFQQLDANIKMTAVSITDEYKIVETKKIENILYNPDNYTLARMILQEIDKIYYKLDTQEFEDNFQVLYFKASSLPHILAEQQNLKISVKLLNNHKRFIVNINREKFFEYRRIYLQQLANIIKQVPFSFSKLKKIIILGKTLEQIDLSKFLGNWTNKIYRCDYRKVFRNLDIEFSLYKDVNELNINDLSLNINVKFIGYDPRPNKGYSEHIFKIIGEGKLQVLKSTRSLKPGDILMPKTQDDMFWTIGKQIKFEVIRNGKKIPGYFLTRAIYNLKIKQ